MLSFGCLILLFVATSNCQFHHGLTEDFQTWLHNNGYAEDLAGFVRSDLGEFGSFGGLTNASDHVTRAPVIFIHGNSDQALNPGPNKGLQGQSGWDNSINYFLNHGYTLAELYGTTWGPARGADASLQTHSCKYLVKLRRFVEAVKGYSGAPLVHLISHSMGVTLGRRVVKGGKVEDTDGTSCDLGSPLTPSIGTFIGISGGNRGLTACFAGEALPTCNNVNGFYPGVCLTVICPGDVPTESKYLYNLDQDPNKEGASVHVYWSEVDEIIGEGGLVWGVVTQLINDADGTTKSETQSHMETKLNTAEWQYKTINNN